MKKTICSFVIVLAVNFAWAQISQPGWRANIKVVDEDGQPIPDATVAVWYYIQPPANQTEASEKIQGLTDTNGVFTASHSNTGSIDLGFQVSKVGYYSTTKGHEFAKFKDSDPAKWNPSETVILKKIGHPIAMYVKKEETKIPKENAPVGFDLMGGDWVAPFGAGKTADVYFTVHRKIISPQEFDADLELTFPNTGDGIVVVPPAPDSGSPLVMPRPAPENGYQSKHTWHYHNLSERPEGVLGYFFRVRTMLDENGNAKSALYGKIQGDVRFYVGQKPHKRA